MKRITLILTALLLLTSCTVTSSPPIDPPPTPSVVNIDVDQYDDYLLYPVSNDSFTTDERGNVYVAEEANGKFSIGVYDLSGQKTETYNLEVTGSVSNICVGDDKLFFMAPTRDWPIYALYSFDLETQEQTQIVLLDRYTADERNRGNMKIAYLDGNVYICAIDPDYVDADYERWAFDLPFYRYEGIVLIRYDITEGTFEIVYDGTLHNFSLTPDGKIMLFAHDGVGGFYFQQLDPANGFALGEKHYRMIYDVADFAADDGGGVIYSAQSMLEYWNMAEDRGSVITAADGTSPADRVVYFKGFTFFYHNTYELKVMDNGTAVRVGTGILERYKNAAYIKDNSSIKMISNGSGIVSRIFPNGYFSEGYNVTYKELGSDEFALTVLSRDKQYDICKLDANDSFSANIKDKGSFYPLNDVPGVAEYLDACFPYVKDAATDKNGSIWMIPLCIDVDAIVYHEENCREAGIDFANAANISDIMENVRKAAMIDPENERYRFIPYRFPQMAVRKYLRDNTSLDTPEFREIASGLKDFMNEPQQDHNTFPARQPTLLFDNAFSFSDRYFNEAKSGVSVTPILGADRVPNPATFFAFVCVNPDSNNLAATLEYISALSRHMMTRNDSLMLKDFYKAYPDSDFMRQFYALYENSVIDFNVSDEVFADDFDRYLRDEISLDELIKEAGRKLAMYLNE